MMRHGMVSIMIDHVTIIYIVCIEWKTVAYYLVIPNSLWRRDGCLEGVSVGMGGVGGEYISRTDRHNNNYALTSNERTNERRKERRRNHSFYR